MENFNIEEARGLLRDKLAPDQPSTSFLKGYSIELQGKIIAVREVLEDDDIVRALVAILDQYKRAVKKHPTWPEDIAKAAGKVSGEAGELQTAANHYDEGRDTNGRESLFMVESEAIDTAVVSLRLLKHHPDKRVQ